DLEHVVQSSLVQVESEIRESQAQIELAGPWPRILAHEPTLVQVLTNLIANAIKFVKPGTRPWVRIRTEVKERGALERGASERGASERETAEHSHAQTLPRSDAQTIRV